MKKVIVIVLAFLMVLAFVGCSSKPAEEPTAITEINIETQTPTPTIEPLIQEVTKTNYINIEGIYVDNSYIDDDNKNLKMLYLFYTVSTKGENLQVSSNSIKIVINDINTYNPEHYSGVCKYMSNYYYKNYLEDVYIGDSLKMVSTFLIPEGDLAIGRYITLDDFDFPEIENILVQTDDIVFFNSAEEIAKVADQDGYASEMKKREAADTETTERVKKAINGYWWKFSISPTSYKIEFFEPNDFTLATSLGSNSGTYTVCNGYVICTYTDTDNIVEIPYTFVDGNIELDLTYAFDYREN